MLSTLHILLPNPFAKISQDEHYNFHPHFTDEENKAQRSEVNCLRSLNSEVVELGFESQWVKVRGQRAQSLDCLLTHSYMCHKPMSSHTDHRY